MTGISVAIGPASGGTIVTITGTGFTNATSVAFGAAGASFTVNSDSSITTGSRPPPTTPSTSPSPRRVGRHGPPIDQFTFIGAPSVNAVSPATGPVEVGPR